ncbi:hypothetical protein FXO38_22480 [Capsicum annuum]|nr:hypothetical protein FXO38_22480 [Capsicum annuum]KAF3654469.1 hypothetical protein FXO37_16457 [Capsicum annuum]
MSVKKYALKFQQLSRYALELVFTMRSKMRKFAYGLSYDLASSSPKAHGASSQASESQLTLFILHVIFVGSFTVDIVKRGENSVIIMRFVESFSSIVVSLTRLTQKKVKFFWSDACESSFEKLKDKLNSVPFLTLPEGTDGFVMFCDASHVGIGCVLIQHGKTDIIADALNKLYMGRLSYVDEEKKGLVKDIHKLANLGVRLPDSEDIKDYVDQQKIIAFEIRGDGLLRYQSKLNVPDVDGLCERILTEAHDFR